MQKGILSLYCNDLAVQASWASKFFHLILTWKENRVLCGDPIKHGEEILDCAFDFEVFPNEGGKVKEE